MAEPLITLVNVLCPICSKRGQIEVKEAIVNKSERGITAVNINEKIVCNHSFVAYIDKNFVVRDSFACDFTVELPQIKIDSLSQIKNKFEFDIDIIKYNMIPTLLANIFKGVLQGKKIAIINEQDSLNQKFINFFSYIFESSFKHDISLIKREDYRKNKKDYKEHLILKGSDIIQDKDKLIDTKKLKIEQTIVHKFFSELDPDSGLIILKNEVIKLHKLCQDLVEFNDNLKENENFTSKRAIDYINKKYKFNISFPYLDLLMDIIKHYFKGDLKKPPESADVMGFL